MPSRTNEQWLAELRSDDDSVRQTALQDLHQLILNGLPFASSRWLPATDPRAEALAQEIAQDAVLRAIERLDSFEGRSRFTTWAYKIAVRLALTELRRRRWKDVSLEELLQGEGQPQTAAWFADRQGGPENRLERQDMLDWLGGIMRQELTGRQLTAMRALAAGMPLEEVARRMDSNRNALYKLMHDARLNLRRRLTREGFPIDEILADFDDR
jgi:RNA polymerase sigma-70 factor (ECF subfamily)